MLGLTPDVYRAIYVVDGTNDLSRCDSVACSATKEKSRAEPSVHVIAQNDGISRAMGDIKTSVEAGNRDGEKCGRSAWGGLKLFVCVILG